MRMPDTRGWLVVGAFALTFYILTLIAMNPKLAEVQLFGAIAMAIVSGGLGAAFGFYLGSSKGSSDKDAVLSAQVEKQP